ncbi:unnamed protein product [Pleuronectes platessa]|uniref:Uncharacterized protein n=1 Tax=Pleuronectes platessa TaxID=8262 RepID=A0A9N7YUX9_PLEPL|nr:unnamed protein product [Pleuronectes platessa]CAB1436497.1 unnamed protein product [Pleuronectes platessa]CAB1438398.1 unnamed protein product [Pleuronectes platessa]CAB1457270.1 unnamed protein product [Pleuronectes platessa]
MVPRGVPSSQQPIRSYAGHAQPVGSERKCSRVALPVFSDLGPGSEGSCVLRRRGKLEKKTQSETCEKGKKSRSTYPVEVRSQVAERRRVTSANCLPVLRRAATRFGIGMLHLDTQSNGQVF